MSDKNRRSGLGRRSVLKTIGASGLVAGIGSAEAATSSSSTQDTDPADAGIATARPITVDDPWQTYSLGGQYDSPVVLAMAPSYTGPDPCHIRLRNVASTSFDARIEEWRYLNDIHYEETVGSVAMEPGTYTLDGDNAVEVGRTVTDHTWTSVSFDQTFETPPLVFCQSETAQGSHAIVTRISDVSTDGFAVRLQEEEATGGFHYTESLGYIAIEPGTGTLDGMAFEAGQLQGDQQWRHLSFENTYTNPVLIAGLQTFIGPDPAGLRHRNLSTSGVDVLVEEEQSHDEEMYHGDEQVGYLVLEAKTDSSSPHTGATIPSVPHAPNSVTPPTGSNFDPSDATAVLTASDVTDYGDVDYVADPFIFVEDGTWHMFFEILNSDRYKDAPIGHATSPDGLDWTYDQIVMSNRKHLSFPLVWKYGGEYYTCPPNGTRVELYRAQDFPTDWQHLGKVIDVDFYPHDPTFVRYDGRWWLFTDRGNRHVMVYYNDSLSVSGWTPHPGNPVVTDRVQAARQGGRPIVVGDRLFLYFQDLAAHYGDKIRCYEVTELTPNTYADREAPGSPTLEEFAEPWANRGMHTFDPWWLGPDRGWRCAVDGCTDGSNDWSIGIVDIPPSQ